MIDRGADVMYAERFGVSDAAKERKGVKVIGNVIDTAAQYPGTVLASALWHMEPTIDRAIKAVLGRPFRGRPTTASSATWRTAARASLIDEKLVPADVVEAREGEGKGDHGRHVPRQRQRRRAEIVLSRPSVRTRRPGPQLRTASRKRFGALVANDAHRPRPQRGEILALLGENGAGKTTLMNILFGHYVADEGTIAVAGPDGELEPLDAGLAAGRARGRHRHGAPALCAGREPDGASRTSCSGPSGCSLRGSKLAGGAQETRTR